MSPSERMPRLAIDMDEVIADPLSKFISLYRRDYGLELPQDLEPGKEIFELVPPEVNQKWYEYINEPGFFRDLPVITGSQEVIKALQKKYDVYIVSAAMEFPNSLSDKLHWLQQHFPLVTWQHIIFCGNKIIDADILIDDRIKTLRPFRAGNYCSHRPIICSSPTMNGLTTGRRWPLNYCNGCTEWCSKLIYKFSEELFKRMPLNIIY